MTTYEWSYGVPFQTDTVNYEWSYGIPYIITELVAGGTTHSLEITIDSVTTTTNALVQTYKIDVVIDGVSTTTYLLSQTYNIETKIDAVTTTSFRAGFAQLLDVLISSVSYIGTLQSGNPYFNRSYFNRMGFGADPEVYSLDLNRIAGFSILIDALTTVEDYLILNPVWMELEVNTTSETTTLLNTICDLISQVDGVTTVTVTQNTNCAVGTTIDSVTTINPTLNTIAGLEIEIDTVSGTVFGLSFTYGYPLKVTLTTSKRGSGLSATKRHTHLNVDR
jgi:hypothetical protein